MASPNNRNDVVARFPWIPFFEEVANKLIAIDVAGRRAELDEACKGLVGGSGGAAGGHVNPLLVIDSLAHLLPGGGTKAKALRPVALEVVHFLGVGTDVPEKWDGIATVSYLTKGNLLVKDGKNIDAIWAYFRAAVSYADNGDNVAKDAFRKVFDVPFSIPNLKWSVLAPTYMARPLSFANLSEDRCRDYIVDKLGLPMPWSTNDDSYHVVTFDEFVGLNANLNQYFTGDSAVVRSFPELSFESLKYKRPKAAKIDAVKAAKPPAAEAIKPATNKTEDKPLLPPALNTVYYGPPGTGKTFMLQKLMNSAAFTTVAVSETRDELLAAALKDKTWWHVIASALLDMGKGRPRDILEHDYVKAKLRGRDIQFKSHRIWGSLQSHCIDKCVEVHYAKRNAPQIFEKMVDGLWRVNSEAMQAEAPELDALLQSLRTLKPIEAIDNRFEYVTFHQSYGYEDFVEGIRPVMPEGEEEEIDPDQQFEIRDGVLKVIAARAEKDPGHQYALFIDEINRGNISKIFGELITLVEEDKRRGADSARPVKLTYSQQDFQLPKNLYIIGTMNTADRSIAFLDIALRRRFKFVEMIPMLDEDDGTPIVKNVDARAILTNLNKRIEFLLDRDHLIGHSYFCKVAPGDAWKHLRDIVRDEVYPLLCEYFYGDGEKVALVLGGAVGSEGKSRIVVGREAKATTLFADAALRDGIDESKVVWTLNEDFVHADIDKIKGFFSKSGLLKTVATNSEQATE